ncbi:MAG TPA: NAD(P)H-dependent oxidoreductase [Burkholderiales bacterium]|nr:NAD(P)H-dependent oxidoreductase [Burkholderiales bacterium]
MTLQVLGICGSLRAKSFNRYLLEAARERMPTDATLSIFTLDGIPPFNQDEEQNPPQAVTTFKKAILNADALLFGSPEYNYSVSGVLKNAIDWATRPYGENPFKAKPAAIMGATIGGMGTSRAQYHLRQILGALNVYTLTQPEMMISAAQECFDQAGKLTAPQADEQLKKLLKRLCEWTEQLKKGGAT